MNDRFTGRELFATIVDFLQPQTDPDYDAIFEVVGIQMARGPIMDDEDSFSVPPRTTIQNGDRFVQIIRHKIHFSPQQLRIFSILGIDFVSRTNETLLLSTQKHKVKYIDEIWDPWHDKIVDWSPALVIDETEIEDTEVSLTVDETFAKLSTIFNVKELAQVKQQFLYEEERDFVVDSYLALRGQVPNESMSSLPVHTLHNVLEESDKHQWRRTR